MVRQYSVLVEITGFSFFGGLAAGLHPSTLVPAHRRDRLEKLLFYITRHPFVQEGITYNRETGHVTYRAGDTVSVSGHLGIVTISPGRSTAMAER